MPINQPFSITRHIYYDDTDAGGVVYHANYLRYMDHARSEFVKAHGIGLEYLQQKHGLLYVVANINIDYRKPTLLADAITISVEIEKIGDTSLIFKQTVNSVQAHNKPVLHASATVTIVIVDASTFKPSRVPEFLKEAIYHAE